MGTDNIQVAEVILATPEEIYEAWLDAARHEAMTGGRATCDGREVGARFTAWDDYIFGEHLELEPNRKIVQSWSTSEFPPGAGPSRVEVLLEPVDDGTRVTVVHSDIPEGQGQKYEGGWHEFYFTPMKKHFGAREVEPVTLVMPEKAAPEDAAPKQAAPKERAKPAPKEVAKAAPKKAAPKKKAKPAHKKAVKAAPKKAAPKKKAKPAHKKAVKAAPKKAAPT